MNNDSVYHSFTKDELVQRCIDLGINRVAMLAERSRLRAELASWQKAFGLLTTLHGSMPIDISDPLRMAKSIEGHVRAELAEAKRDAERYRLLRNHVSWYDVDHDFDVEARNVPVLASVSAYVWYHATDVKGETLDDVVDALAAEGEK